MAGEQQSVLTRYCTAPCPTAMAQSRRCWWLCFGSCARRPGRVGSRPRGSPQWRASGATDADAIRHQVGARSSQMDQGTRRHAGYAATAVRPDGSRNPRSCVVPMRATATGAFIAGRSAPPTRSARAPVKISFRFVSVPICKSRSGGGTNPVRSARGLLNVNLESGTLRVRRVQQVL